MTIDIKKYKPKPYEIRAVQITEDNMAEVAKWAKAQVRTEVVNEETGETQPYIKINMYRMRDPRLGKGYPGDWITKRGGDYRVYTDKAFREGYVDDENSIPLGKSDSVAYEGSIHHQMIAERSKGRETFLAVSGHETRFVTPPAGVPMRGMEVEISSVTPPDGIPSFVRKDETEMTEEERDAYYAKLEERYKKDTGGGRIIMTVEPNPMPMVPDPSESRFFSQTEEPRNTEG